MEDETVLQPNSRVYIVIVNWNGWRDTIECLESLLRSDYPDFRVIVCDNGSTDGSPEQIELWADGQLIPEVDPESKLYHLSTPHILKPVEFSYYSKDRAESGGDFTLDPPLVLVRNGENLGFAGGNNVGIRYALARGDFSHIWLLNNDTVVDPGALTALVGRIKTKPDAGMCGSALFYYDNPVKVQALGGGWHCKWIGLPWHYGRFNGRYESGNAARAEAWMNYVEGASMLVSKVFIEEIGLMCEDYFLYFEETDWAIRAKGRFTLAYAPESIVYHKVGGSIGTSSNPLHKSATCDHYSIRNRLRFTARYFPHALPSICFVLAGAFLVRAFFMRWDRAAMIIRTLYQFFTVEYSSVRELCRKERA